MCANMCMCQCVCIRERVRMMDGEIDDSSLVLMHRCLPEGVNLMSNLKSCWYLGASCNFVCYP